MSAQRVALEPRSITSGVSIRARGVGSKRLLGSWAVLAHASRPSAVEYRPADVVSQPLIVQDKSANRIRQLVALPAALEPAPTLVLAFRRSRAHGLDRVGCGAELVRGDVRDRRRLTGSIRGVALRSAQIPGRRHR